MNIAITGTVGSGKSRVAAILTGMLPMQHVDTDILCRQLLLPDQPGWNDLKERWPERFFSTDGTLDRVRLREAVFTDPEIRESLESILHPRVRETVAAFRRRAAAQEEHLLVEVPLLFETGWNQDFDYVVAVFAPSPCCVARTMMRDHVPHHQAESIVALQLSAEEKAKRADSVVDNSGIWAATVLQVSFLVRNLQRLGLYHKMPV